MSLGETFDDSKIAIDIPREADPPATPLHCIRIVTKNCQTLPKIIIFSVKIGQILIGKRRQATPYH
jgi:hypothetical protein